MSGFITMTCQCGHADDLDNFCRTPVSGDLPAGHFQCPACGYAFKKVQSEYRVLKSGDSVCFIPGKVELVPIQRVM